MIDLEEDLGFSDDIGIETKTVDEWLNSVSYVKDPNYVPSKFAMEFVNFIKLVNGGAGEENITPVLHLKMLDQIDMPDSPKIANMVHRGAAKALCIESQIPTPNGNVRLAELNEGDTIFDRNGLPTKILRKSEVFNKPMYLITLTDGRKLKVSEDHINIVQRRKTGKGVPSNTFTEFELTVPEILKKGLHYNRKVSYHNPTGLESKWFIPTAKAVRLPAVDFPVDPYTVGLILGDGSVDTSTGYSRIHCHVEDSAHYLNSIPYECSDVKYDTGNEHVTRFGILGLGALVKEYVGVHNCYSKRVPQKLLWGSIEQRLAVLRGLMDTDGTVGDKLSSTTFSTVSVGLANDVEWLVRSLGGEAITKKNNWNGRDSYRVHIRIDINPFSLPRKADKWYPNTKGRTAIESIKLIPTVPSQCLMVESDTHSFLAESFVVTHNTTLLGEYLFLYLAVFGELPTFGRVDLAIYVSDSIDNGVKNMRKNLEYRYDNSAFLKKFVPSAKFTDIRWEFTNAAGKKFIVKGYGAKALSLDTELHTETGRITIEEVQVGDRIFGADGKLCTVTQKSEVFNKPMYQLTLEDGRSLRVSEDHYNPVVINAKPNGIATWEDRTLTTLELLEQPLKHSKKGSSKHLVKVRNIEPMEFQPKELPIDPYSLGVILGDGRIRKDCGSVELTCHKDELAHYHKEIPYVFGALHEDKRSNAVTQSIRGLGKILKDMELNVRGELKFIPWEYFYGSIDQRLALLQGLMDTDGTCDARGRTSFTSSSHQLCDDLACLVRSLGGTAFIREESGVAAWRVEIWMTMPVFRLQRKLARFKPRERIVNLVSIQRIKDEPSQCIAVDNEERQFIADCYFRTHNTGVRGTKELGTRPQLAVLDDLVSDEDARSKTVIAAIEDTVTKAIEHAMHPRKNKIIWSGTPFNAGDPLYKAVESGAWLVNCYPVCEKFPCTKEEFKGSWEDRFTYDYVRRKYVEAMKQGKIASFNQELMLRIMSDEDRLILDSDINWYKRGDVLKNLQSYNTYITTDFATTENESGDYAVISVWAVNSSGHKFWIDGICARQGMDKNTDDLFRLAQRYKPLSVGIEVTGQQEGFIPWVKAEMVKRRIFFNLASSGNSNRPGIRPNTNKLQRFYVVVPWFKAGEMFFPEEMRLEKTMIEMMEEIKLASSSGLKSKHDDAIDTISMLAVMPVFLPSEEVTMQFKESSGVFEVIEDSTEVSTFQTYTV